MADDATLEAIQFSNEQKITLQKCRTLLGDTNNHDKLVKCAMELRHPNQVYCWGINGETEGGYSAWKGKFRPAVHPNAGALQIDLVNKSEKSTCSCDQLIPYYDLYAKDTVAAS